MKLRSALKAEYLYRPAWIFRRAWRGLQSPPDDFDCPLPWKATLRVKPHEVIGRSLWKLGIYDLPVSECLWRLANPGDFAVDCGANIGYTASLLAARVGPKGKVLAIEPHPRIFEQLKQNMAPAANVEVGCFAVSDREGRAELLIPDEFGDNEGSARLAAPDLQGERIPVALKRLDDLIDPSSPPALIKMDVEGAEMDALRGGTEILKQDGLRTIIYEDHMRADSKIPAFLAPFGFTVFRITRGLSRPGLLPSDTPLHPGWEPPNYIATKDPEDCAKEIAKPGWTVLGGT